MAWLIVFLALVVVIGPVLYLVPSARDKRLAALRGHARVAGLGVKISRIPKLNPTADERVSAGGELKTPVTECIAYQLPVSASLPRVTQLMLIRMPLQATVGIEEVLPGWALNPDSDREFWTRVADSAALQRGLHECLMRLPDDTQALAISDRHVACYWLEKTAPEDSAMQQAVTDIKSALALLMNELVAQFGQDS